MTRDERERKIQELTNEIRTLGQQILSLGFPHPNLQKRIDAKVEELNGLKAEDGPSRTPTQG